MANFEEEDVAWLAGNAVESGGSLTCQTSCLTGEAGSRFEIIERNASGAGVCSSTVNAGRNARKTREVEFVVKVGAGISADRVGTIVGEDKVGGGALLADQSRSWAGKTVGRAAHTRPHGRSRIRIIRRTRRIAGIIEEISC